MRKKHVTGGTASEKAIKGICRAARKHNSDEEKIRIVLDGLMRLRTKNGPTNMALIRHTLLNIIKQIPDKASIKVRRKAAAWDDECLFNAFTNGE